ncbi:4590_t:CDS:2 [Entrophospora sp. SA101]|nr:101_t:CDS:2 [Entrophospora sp. SA101]CAJ0838118.1 4584_t:CDS:2 [Entrophospora sp. SA101]CAJ0838130.1 4589_t:CDS:2 [Entrophospora sp. SA101]CAJ0838133.1 4590_t:CDS:2 [Entrophospora sp. SA101]
MYLNNNMVEKGICNGTVGVIADIDHTQDLVRIVFCINDQSMIQEYNCLKEKISIPLPL